MANVQQKSGGMDIRQQQAMWESFKKLTVVSVVATIVVLALMAVFLL